MEGFLGDVRAFYDVLAEDYTLRLRDELRQRPLERAMLAVFAELVRDAGGGPVLDVGCGPGRITAHLRDLGLDASGVDLSPRMVEIARREYPDLRFEVGTMTALDLPDGGLGGVVAWYSLIHVPPDRLPDVLAGFYRVLAPDGYALFAFQVGDAPLRVDQPLGHPVSLDFQRLLPDRLADQLGAAGFEVQARLVRERRTDEKVPQAMVLAQKP